MAESIVGPWARDKLDRLGKYLNAYTTIMNKQQWCEGFHYIDAFAGPGAHSVRTRSGDDRRAAQRALLDVSLFPIEHEEQQEFLAGSPRVALDLEHPFSTYVFVERAANRVAALKMLEQEYGRSRRIVIRNEDCTKYLRSRVASNPKIDWSTNRALVFLDPFGMQVGWQTIEALAATKSIEIFLNFPVGMAIQRLLHRNPRSFSEAQRRRLDEYFGASEWIDVLYKPIKTLFDEDEHVKVGKSGDALVKWYRSRLSEVFPHVSKAALIRNTKGGHLYYLLLATHNKTGVRVANSILSAGETIS